MYWGEGGTHTSDSYMIDQWLPRGTCTNTKITKKNCLVLWDDTILYVSEANELYGRVILEIRVQLFHQKSLKGHSRQCLSNFLVQSPFCGILKRSKLISGYIFRFCMISSFKKWFSFYINTILKSNLHIPKIRLFVS